MPQNHGLERYIQYWSGAGGGQYTYYAGQAAETQHGTL
jgi:hypothetical protein